MVFFLYLGKYCNLIFRNYTEFDFLLIRLDFFKNNLNQFFLIFNLGNCRFKNYLILFN